MTLKNDQELKLKDILIFFRKGLSILIMLPLIAIIISAYISVYGLSPVYQATTTLMVGKTPAFDIQQQNNFTNLNKNLPYDDAPISNQLLNTYSHIARSRSVCEQVINQNKLNISPESFSKKIYVRAIKDTQLISINITDKDPQIAAYLANQTALAFMEKIQHIMQYNNVKIIDHPVVPEAPIKPNILLNILVSGTLGLFIAAFVVFMRQWFVKTIESSQQAEHILEMPVLASIPEIKKVKR